MATNPYSTYNTYQAFAISPTLGVSISLTTPVPLAVAVGAAQAAMALHAAAGYAVRVINVTPRH